MNGTTVIINGKVYIEALCQFTKQTGKWEVTLWDEVYPHGLEYDMWRRIRIPLPKVIPLNEGSIECIELESKSE